MLDYQNLNKYKFQKKRTFSPLNLSHWIYYTSKKTSICSLSSFIPFLGFLNPKRQQWRIVNPLFPTVHPPKGIFELKSMRFQIIFMKESCKPPLFPADVKTLNLSPLEYCRLKYPQFVAFEIFKNPQFVAIDGIKTLNLSP